MVTCHCTQDRGSQDSLEPHLLHSHVYLNPGVHERPAMCPGRPRVK